MQAGVGHAVGIQGQQEQQRRAQAGHRVVFPSQPRGQQGEDAEDGGPHRARRAAGHQAKAHQNDQKNPQGQVPPGIQEQGEETHQEGHMQAGNDHHMAQAHPVELVLGALLQAAFLAGEQSLEKARLVRGIQAVQQLADLLGQIGRRAPQGDALAAVHGHLAVAFQVQLDPLPGII